MPRRAGTVSQGGADIDKVTAFVGSVESIYQNLINLDDIETRAGFWKQHPYKGVFENCIVEIPLEEGSYKLRLETSENSAGNKGYQEAECLVYKEPIPGSEDVEIELIGNVFIPEDCTQQESETVHFYYGERSPILPPDQNTDPELREQQGEESSLKFKGDFYEGDTTVIIKEVFRNNTWEVPQNGVIIFDDTVVEKVKVDIIYQTVNGGTIILENKELEEVSGIIQGEAKANYESRIFRGVLAVQDIEEEIIQGWAVKVEYKGGNRKGDFNPSTIRIMGIGDNEDLDDWTIRMKNSGVDISLTRSNDGNIYLNGGSEAIGWAGPGTQTPVGEKHNWKGFVQGKDAEENDVEIFLSFDTLYSDDQTGDLKQAVNTQLKKKGIAVTVDTYITIHVNITAFRQGSKDNPGPMVPDPDEDGWTEIRERRTRRRIPLYTPIQVYDNVDKQEGNQEGMDKQDNQVGVADTHIVTLVLSPPNANLQIGTMELEVEVKSGPQFKAIRLYNADGTVVLSDPNKLKINFNNPDQTSYLYDLSGGKKV
ncbi:hypothetical protein ACFL6F_03545, partial [Planctomycetota bacterium]